MDYPSGAPRTAKASGDVIRNAMNADRIRLSLIAIATDAPAIGTMAMSGK
jgi:hypothetical protein